MLVAFVAIFSCFAYSVSAQVAVVDGENYASLQEAIAVANGKTVKLLSDIEVDTKTFTIADGQNVVLDMNNMSITATDNASGNYELFYIYGELTVKGNGTINLASTIDRNWNNMSAIFHNRGGVLTIENGTFINNGGTDMAFTIDNSGNYFGDATTNIHGGLIKSSYIAIRNRMEQNSHGYSGKTYLNITGGTIEGVRRTIWGQAASVNESAPAQGEINISGGEVRGLIETPQANGAESMTTVTGGSVENFIGEVGELKVTGEAEVTGEVTLYSVSAEGTKTEVEHVVNSDGVYVEKVEMPVVATVGATEYTDIYEAFDAADGKVVRILQDLELSNSIVVEYNYDVTVEGTGRTIRFVNVDKGFQVAIGATVTFGEGLTIEGAGTNVCPLYIEDATVVSSANFVTTADNTCSPITTATRNAVLTINGGTIDAKNPATVAINWLSPGTLTVKDGTIQGASAIVFKSGSLVISGGDFNGTEEAVVVETAGGKTGVRAVAISGGNFTSENAAAVVSNSTNPSVDAMAKFISGGTFSSNVEALLAVGYKTQDNGDGTYSVVRDTSVEYVAQVGSLYYTSLEEAVAALSSVNSKLTLLKDVTLTNTINLVQKGTTIDLNGKTITANCRKAFQVYANATIKNGAILAENRCVDTRLNVHLVLEDLDLKATTIKHGNTQPITVGGYDNGTTIEMNNVNVDFAEGCYGYAIISFVKTNLTATNCKFTNAYNVLYAREDDASNSVFTFNNCNMYANTPGYDPSNWFALIAIRANNVTVNVNGGLLHSVGQVSAINLHGYSETLGTAYAEGCTIKLSAETEIIGDLINESKENFSENTIIMPASEDYIAQLKAENFYIQDNGDGTVTPLKDVAFVDVDFAYTNDADLENMKISYQRTFPKHSIWISVFFPFEIPLSMLLENYQVAEWTGVLYEKNGAGEVTSCGIELTKLKNPADTLKANYPYLVYPKNEAARNFEIVLDDATLYAADEDNVQTITTEVMTCSMKGNYRTMQKAELADGWIVGTSGNWVRSAGTMKPFRLFLTREWADDVQVNLSSSAMRFVFRDSDGVTAIENAEQNVLQEDVVFDLQGRRVVNPTKGGIYIVNGKKIIKK